MALTTDQTKIVASAGMIAATVGAAYGFIAAPKRFRGDDAVRYGLLLGAVGAVGAAIFVSTPAGASPALPAATP